MLDISMDVRMLLPVGMRVCKDDWFADVPSWCDWIGGSSTCVSVVASTDEKKGERGECLELSGTVLIRDEKRVVISCGGLVVSVIPSLVSPDATAHVTVVFTRSCRAQ